MRCLPCCPKKGEKLFLDCRICGGMRGKMKEQDELKKNVDELKKIANQPATRRRSLLSPNERSVIFGILFAILAGLLTLSLDLIAVPEKDSTLWILIVFLYALLILITVLIERFLIQKFEVRRTLYYVVVHIMLLLAIITLIIMGVRHPESIYNVSTEFSYAMAIGFTEIALFLYHLGRVIVLAIVNHAKDKPTKAVGNKK